MSIFAHWLKLAKNNIDIFHVEQSISTFGHWIMDMYYQSQQSLIVKSIHMNAFVYEARIAR